MKEEFKSMINYSGDIEVLSRKICDDYKLGDFVSNKIVLLGYEES